jgi:SMI1 / KNR4 family (SUKH-1)
MRDRTDPMAVPLVRVWGGLLCVALHGIVSESSAVLFILQPSNSITRLDVRAYDPSQLRGRATLAAGAQSCELVWSGRDAPLSCALALAAEVSTITLTGEFSAESGKRMQKGTMRWQVVDMASFLRPLRERTRLMGDRVRDFLKQKAFEARHASVLEAFYLSNEMADPAPEIAAAEKRLGFPLPAEHRHLLSTVGGLRLGDSSMTHAAEIKRSYAAMIDDWETPKSELDKALTKSTRALLEGTTLLYTEVGDGYGGLLYRPAGEPKCADGPAYYWIHQDEINEPELLQRAGGGCVDYTSAMIYTIAQDGLVEYDSSEPNVVVVDRSAPEAQRLELAYEGRGFAFRLRQDWSLFQ